MQTKNQLLRELEKDRAHAGQYHGSKPFRYRSSEAIDRHNRMVRKCEQAGEITNEEANRLAIRY